VEIKNNISHFYGGPGHRIDFISVASLSFWFWASNINHINVKFINLTHTIFIIVFHFLQGVIYYNQ
jgi:hypothetical protein